MENEALPTRPIQKVSRLCYLDWLRVMAIFTIFLYHSLRFFTIEYWHVKNPTTYLGAENFDNYLETWMMPLIFMVSGASVFFATQKNKPAWKIIWDKVLRLLVPLLVSVFTLSILQVYLERLSHGDFYGSFWAFLPHYFEGLYGFGGNFAWMGLHLWYLEVLFVFALIFLPVILVLKKEKGKRFLSKFGDYLAAPGVIYILVLVAIFSWKLLNPEGLLGMPIFGWPLGIYFSFFLAGYLFASNENLMSSIQRLRWISLVGALCTSILFFATQDHADLLVWFVVLTFLGFGRKDFSFSSPLLTYANQAVLPFYILHQPVLLCIGYFVVRWQIPDALKYMVIALPSFFMTVVIYEFLVRRNNLLRPLFGMKPHRHPQQLRTTVSVGRLDFLLF